MLTQEDFEIIQSHPERYTLATKKCPHCGEECPTSVYRGRYAKRDFEGRPALLTTKPLGAYHKYFCKVQRTQEQIQESLDAYAQNQKFWIAERKIMIEEGIKNPQSSAIIARLIGKGLWLDLKHLEEDQPQEQQEKQTNTPLGMQNIDVRQELEDSVSHPCVGHAKAPDFKTAEDIYNDNIHERLTRIESKLDSSLHMIAQIGARFGFFPLINNGVPYGFERQ